MRCIILSMLLCSAVLSAAPAAWRDVTVPAGSDRKTAVLHFFVPENLQGFRLLDSSGVPVPITVTMSAHSEKEVFFNPGKQKRFRLELFREKIRNQPAEQRSGVLHLFRSYNGAAVKSVAEFRNFWKVSDSPVRAEWVHQIFSGVNRLGPSLNSLNIYVGFFPIEKAGEYTFYTASTDASFLLVDGKLVTSYPGFHNVYSALNGKYKGVIRLEKGVHKIEYLHANAQWTCYAIAAKSVPGSKRMEVLYRNFFVPSVTASAGPLMDPSGKRLPDHSWKLMYVIEEKNDQLSFWKVDGKKNCYFFSPGEYVMLDGFRLQNRWHFHVPPVPEARACEMLRDFLKQNEKKKLPPNVCRMLAIMIPVFKDRKAADLFMDRILRGGNEIPTEYAFNFYRTMILKTRIEKEAYEQAIRELSPMLPEKRSGVSHELARIFLYGTGDVKKADSFFRQIKPRELTPDAQTEYKLLEADLALFVKGYDASAELYSKMKSVTKTMSSRQIVESEGKLISLRNALITKRYKDAMFYLEQMSGARPEIRINSELMWLKARFFVSLGYPRRAAVLCRALLLVQPSASAAAGAMLYLGQFEMKRGNKNDALRWFDRLKQEYPASRESAEADRNMR